MSSGSDRPFVPPIERMDAAAQHDGADPLGTFDGSEVRFRLHLDADERAFFTRLLGELKTLLTSEETEQTAPLLHRLFPPAFHDDPEKEAEYQRLMRDELVASRVAAIDNVTALLDIDDPPESGALLSEGEVMMFMQSVNAIRLVLGTMLDITDDESSDAADLADSYESNLYEYLGWLLEWTVRALSDT